VRTVLVGTFLRSSNGMHLTARLLNLVDGGQLWSARLACGREELIPLGTGVVRQVTRQLNLSLDDQVLRRLETNLVRKLEAYRLYSRASALSRSTRSGVNRAIELLNQAIGEDSHFALAHAALANFYSEADWLLPPKQCKTEAKKNALRALEIDNSLPLAHTTLGFVLWDYEWDFKEAEAQFRRAIELGRRNPRASAARAYSTYGLFLASQGRFDEADDILAEGERIEPNTQVIAAVRCWRYHFDHRFEEVIQEATRLLSRFPNDPVGLERLAYALQKLGHPEEALAVVQPLHQVDPGPESLAELGIFQAWAGRLQEARKAFEDLRATAQARPDWMARILVALGEHEQAIEQIQQGVEQRYLGPIWMVDPIWDDVRSDPRIQVLLKKMGLE
jgi:tetratricopeptide (TPR) repeat protein